MVIAKLTFYHFPETWFKASHQQIRRFQRFRICIVDQNAIVIVFVCQEYNSIVSNANFKAPPLVLRYYTRSNLDLKKVNKIDQVWNVWLPENGPKVTECS